MSETRPYRRNVGVVVFNSDGHVLAGERSDRPGVCQFPQGGVDPGEEPLAAARRELFEETGLQLDDAPVHEIGEWLRYDFPPDPEIERGIARRFRGQDQRWYFFHWDGEPRTLEMNGPDPEFSRLFWSAIEPLVAGMAPFKRAVYQRVADEAGRVIPQYLETRT